MAESVELKDWVLVPREPTLEMREAGDGEMGSGNIYRAMISASPAPEGGEEGKGSSRERDEDLCADRSGLTADAVSPEGK